MPTKEWTTAKEKAEQQLDIKITEEVAIPEPLPATEREWWRFIEYLGEVQWCTGRFLRRNSNDELFSKEIFKNEAEVLLDVSKNLAFWAGVVAQRYNILLPKDCPPANKTCRAGEEISEMVRKILEITDTVVPLPPPGKKYWWDWYGDWKEKETGGTKAVEAQFKEAPSTRKLIF